MFYPATCSFWHRSDHKYRESEILYLKTGLSLQSVRSEFLNPKKLTHTKFQDERMTRTIVITENENS